MQVKKIFSDKKVTKVGEGRTIAELGFKESGVQLVEVFGTLCILLPSIVFPCRPQINMIHLEASITSKVGRDYEQLFLRAETKGEITEDDLWLNDIAEEDASRVIPNLSRCSKRRRVENEKRLRM
jgi:hypothetical protein